MQRAHSTENALSARLELLDWRRRVSELFAELRRRSPDAETLAWFRARKDELLRTHTQSPLPAEERARFHGLPYWPYDPAARLEARLSADEAEAPEVPTSTGAEMAFSRIGFLEFCYAGQQCRLGAYWIQGYAGGLFIPFRDATSGHESYGGGRYLLDTIKSADLGSDAASGTVTLDFNYAYNPSCAYDPQWTCPLAPPENWLTIAVRAGERGPTVHGTG
jgi:uncharacterized protein (DUF1684 family)